MIDRLSVFHVDTPTERIDHEFFGQTTIKVGLLGFPQDPLQLANVIELFTGEQFSGGIDRLAAITFSPHPQCVEIL